MPTEIIDKMEADFDKAVPLLAIVNSLAATYAGNIYRRIAGSVESLASWTTGHPEITTAVDAIEPIILTLLPGSAAVIGAMNSGINLGEHVLGALGKLMAADATVQGPQPGLSVPPVTAQPAA